MFDDEKVGGAPAEPIAEDRDDRIERAQDMWDKSATVADDPDKAATDKAAADAAAIDGADKSADDKAAADKVAADKAEADKLAAAGDDTKLPYFNEPRFQEIYKEHGEQKATLAELTNVFTGMDGKLGYKIDSTETLQGVLQDAYTLYDIASGQKSVAELLTQLEKNWKPEQSAKVFQDLANYAASKGVKVDDKAVADKPWEKELTELRNKIGESEKVQAAREKAEVEQKAQTERMTTVVTPMIDKVTELCKAAGLDPKQDKDEIDDFCNHISSAIGTDKNKEKIIEQIKKGQWGEVERLYTEHHNKLVARAKRLGDTVLKAKLEKDKGIPKVPAGGAAASRTQAAAVGKRDLKTSEGRIAAAEAEWKKGA